jgi:hypothetical protein
VIKQRTRMLCRLGHFGLHRHAGKYSPSHHLPV